MSEDSSLVFFFKSGFQSWLMFAQNCGLPPPRPWERGCRLHAVITSVPGASAGCARSPRGDTCSVPASRVLTSLTKTETACVLPVMAVFPLLWINTSELLSFLKTHARLFPMFWGELLTHSVYITHCDFDVLAPSLTQLSSWGTFVIHQMSLLL